MATAAAARSPTIVVDIDTERVLTSTDAQLPWYPASLTKLMTVYLAFEAMKAGRLDADAKLSASEHAAAQTGTRLGLTKGASLTVMEAILATILRSANDAAVVLAEKIGGTEASFAQSMTERARALGMASTAFRNATGLPDPLQSTTAADMVLLARALLRDFPDRYPLFGTPAMTYQGHRLSNINGLLGSFPGADGMKTGFTCGSGYNIVASAQSAGRRLIAVVLGATSLDARRGEVTRLLQAGFSGKMPKDGAVGAAASLAALPAAEPKAAVIRAVLPGGCDIEAARPAPLQAWALTVGNAHQERDAKALIDAAKKALGGDLRGARPSVVHRHVGGLPPYRALIIGFDETKAIATCLRLRRLDVHCIVLNPEQLGAAHAIWN